MQPEDKLAITFIVLCIITVGSALILSYIFGYMYYYILQYIYVNCIIPTMIAFNMIPILQQLKLDDLETINTLLFIIGQFISWLPVMKQVYRLYLGYLTFGDIEKGIEFTYKSIL